MAIFRKLYANFEIAMLSKTGKTLISTLVLLTGISIVPVSAQWEGSVKADGGWNFQRSNKENADLKLKYSNEKFNKEDFNYEMGTAIEVLLNETTKLSSSLAYISEKESAYNLKGEDVIANLRFSKVLTKGLDLYLEFNDIVDKDIYEETWNADKNYLKVTTTSPMQRAAIIGISYIF